MTSTRWWPMAQVIDRMTVKRARNQARLVATFELEFDDVAWPDDAIDVLRTRLGKIPYERLCKMIAKAVGNVTVRDATVEAAK
jgi:hypothetical protein